MELCEPSGLCGCNINYFGDLVWYLINVFLVDILNTVNACHIFCMLLEIMYS